MVWLFSVVYSLVIVQRLWELRLAKKNASRIVEMGGYEVGAGHYKYIVLLHVLFLSSLFVEFAVRVPAYSLSMIAPAVAFLLLQASRVWCIRSLGVHWNTRIFIVPGLRLVRKGPYRFMRHPNYVVVTLEMLMLPLLFGCFMTALLFPLVNVAVLRIRIRAEEQALELMLPAAELEGETG